MIPSFCLSVLDMPPADSSTGEAGNNSLEKRPQEEIYEEVSVYPTKKPLGDSSAREAGNDPPEERPEEEIYIEKASVDPPEERQFLFRDPEVFAETEHISLERNFQRRKPSEIPDNEAVPKLHRFIKEHIASL